MSRAIVLFSGGLDSTACLYWALENYDNVILLSFLYGSKEDKPIKICNSKFSSLFSLKNQIIDLPFLSKFAAKSKSSLSVKGSKPPEFSSFKDLNNEEIIAQTAKQVWVPGRNLLFLSIAASLADSYPNPTEIIFGGNKEEAATFPDNTIDFVEKMNDSLRFGCMNKVVIKAPFIRKTKVDIVTYLAKTNAQVQFSSSCYNVTDWKEGNIAVHCGVCESCSRRRRAFKNAKIKDVTEYKN